jgi:DNA excision repair protein ERCC-3
MLTGLTIFGQILAEEEIFMVFETGRPVIVQSDNTILLEVDNPHFEQARDVLASFAELVKSPEHIHTYRITPLSLWNAASAGWSAGDILDGLSRFSRYEIPENVIAEIESATERYGKIILCRKKGDLVLESEDPLLITEIWSNKSLRTFFEEKVDEEHIRIKPDTRGHVKQALIRLGFPVKDIAGYVEGAPLQLGLREIQKDGKEFSLRDYQKNSVQAFYREGTIEGGSGVVVLPCGAGKTIVGLGAMEKVGAQTLILVTNTVALRQWRDEILNKTTLGPEQISEYSGESKNLGPVTIATYQILTWRKKKGEEFPHFKIFNAHNWGLIIYDEVHLLPAPVFRITAEIQSRRRLGLTATLVREDGLEEDVFSLIGPKRYDVPWKTLEKQGWIAKALCQEIRIPLDEKSRLEYATAKWRRKFRVASENPWKIEVARRLLQKHPEAHVLIIGQYLDQLKSIAREFECPLITGSTPTAERQRLYGAFRTGEEKRLVVSKVANFAIDLPDANVAIQVSGTFGSRQEEAQRLGRILRPKSDGGQAYFYSLVTKNSRDQEFAANRQLFLTEQGYKYVIREWRPDSEKVEI